MTAAGVDIYDIDYLEGLSHQHPEWGPVEVIDDALYVQPMASELHQLVALNLASALLAARPPGWRVSADTYWRAGASRMPRPDLSVYRTDRPPERRAFPEKPFLVAEVLSQDRDHDLVLKARLYQDVGVEQYVVIDPELVDGWWAAVLPGGHRTAAGEPLRLELPGWSPLEVRLEDLLAG